jgi:hypothetical protein
MQPFLVHPAQICRTKFVHSYEIKSNHLTKQSFDDIIFSQKEIMVITDCVMYSTVLFARGFKNKT